jgi:uncharacterized protein YlxW (UPF0749 family)
LTKQGMRSLLCSGRPRTSRREPRTRHDHGAQNLKELRAAEDRITQLEAEVERFRDRATRAERWLETIKQEIEDKLIAPMKANRPELPLVH